MDIEQIDRIEALLKQVAGVSDAMVEALRAARNIFEGYAASATIECTPTGDANAERYAELAMHMHAALEDAKRARTAGPKLAYYQTHEPPHCPTCDCGGQ
jgi:hypothetical protein